MPHLVKHINSVFSFFRSCLSLVFYHPDVERERKLIDALKDINSFGVQISPLKGVVDLYVLKLIKAS